MPRTGQDKASSDPGQTSGSSPPRQSGIVRDIMREAVELLHPDHDLSEARRRMAESRGTMLPVVDGDEVVGILTSQMVSRRLAEQGQDSSPMDPAGQAHVRDDMTTSIPLCRADETLAAAAAAIERESRPGLLVINEADELVGIVDRADFAAAGFVFSRAEGRDDAPGATAHAVKSSARARGERPGALQSYSVKPRVRR